MTITEAQNKIDEQLKAGQICLDEALWLGRMIRRTGAYGNKWSARRQAEMRAKLLGYEGWKSR